MVEVNNTTSKKINQAATRRLCEAFMASYRRRGWELSVALVGPAKMRSLNKRYRGMDKPTDVLSFDGDESRRYMGEVVINLDEVAKADKYLDVFGLRKPAGYIYDFLLIHGLLHLVGYDDKTEKGRHEMLQRGEDFLAGYKAK